MKEPRGETQDQQTIARITPSPLSLPSPSLLGDLAVLKKLLTSLLEQHLPRLPHLNVVNMACGKADETGTLSQLLTAHSPSCELHHFDIRSREINDARARWKDRLEKEHPSLKLHFRTHNGSKELLLGNKVDLYFIRHQNYWFDPAGWVELYDQALRQLSQAGILVVTSYFDREHVAARMQLEMLGAKELQYLRNPHSRLLINTSDCVKSVDRHLSVFRRTL